MVVSNHCDERIQEAPSVNCTTYYSEKHGMRSKLCK